MKKKQPWQRGYIPPRREKIEPETPEGWVLESKRNNYRIYRWTPTAIYGPRAEVRGIHNQWSLWFGDTPWTGSLPSEGVFRAPDMTASSLQALATWWQIELSNKSEPQVGWDPGTVTGWRVGKSVLFGAAYGYSSGPSKLIDTLKANRQTDLYKDFVSTLDFGKVEKQVLTAFHDEVQVHVEQSEHRPADPAARAGR